MEAQQKNLEHRVDFATIDLKLSEEYKAKLDSAAPAISTPIHNAAVNGYRNVADTLLSMVLVFAEYRPVLVFWLPSLVLYSGLASLAPPAPRRRSLVGAPMARRHRR